MPLIIGVTGSIATGKSSACRLMAERGATHLDADRLVHRLYDPGKPAFDRIVGIFGDEIVGEDGYIDRKILGSKVFGKPEEMTKLTTAIGNIAEAVKEVVDGWNNTLGEDDVAVLEAVNLIEAGYGQWCDAVWLFACEEDTARRRLMRRNGFSVEEANQRLTSQRDWQERAPASDRVFHNDNGIVGFEAEVGSAYAEAARLARDGRLPVSKYYDWWERRNG
jgi:dephospho-CoA kinase